MINRILLRIKIVQILYSFYKSDSKSVENAEKELFFSIGKTYELYNLLLLLIIEITTYAQKRIDIGKNKFIPTADELKPNNRFAENKFVKQLSANKQLKAYLKEKKITWVNYESVVKNIYDEVISSSYYEEYMSAEENTYEDDKNIWRKIFKKSILNNEELEATLEEQSIYWNDDIDIVISFLLKTIKKFEEGAGVDQVLLPMFKDEEDADFAKKLFRNVLLNREEYSALIDIHTKNWELDRIAFMDVVIMEIAIAELMSFPSIPVNVTLNEYIEISKTYSTDKSNTFINGVLDNIVTQLKNENKLIKAKMYTSNEK
jgi:transcription antitermination protein NusB